MAKNAPTVPRIDGAVFLVLAYDGLGSEAARDAELEAHLDYVERHYERYLVCGPLRNPGEEPLIGSFFLVQADTADDAEALVSGDPYVKSGMYAEIRVQEATAAGGRFMGGVIWESAEAIRAAAS
ncbi:MAG: YciI family protein [Pseudomonadota bacterium]